MAVKKTIAIVGATEKIGTEIANKLAQSDYRLLLVSNDNNQLTQLSKSIRENKPDAEIDAVDCVKDGCWEADIIILSVSFHEEIKVAGMIKDVATQKIVVSISNQKNADKELQHLLPYSKLVSVSNIFKSKEIFIAGDDEEANEEIVNIFQKAGYHPAIASGLSAIK